MRRFLLALIGVIAMLGVLWAQATPQVKWEHDGVNVTSFKCVVDGGTPTDLGMPTPVGTTYSVDITACTGVMVNGAHSLVIQACNATGCTSAAAITVVKL